MRFGTRLGAATLVVLMSVAGAATPAWAHGTSAVGATNYRTRVLDMSPAVPGLAVDAVDLGDHLELRNDTGTEITVLGYNGEPYLRVGPDGVFENLRSPATYENRSSDPGDTEIPESADPEAEPEWRRTSTGTTVRWHDHRAHWTRVDDPEVVQRDRGSSHVVQDWTVELQMGDEDIVVTGDIVWVPPPSPWGWLVASAFLLGLVALLARRRAWVPVVAVALAAAIAAQVVLLVAQWQAVTSPAIGNHVYGLLAIALGTGALAWLLARRDPYDAAPVVLFAGLLLALGGGLANLSAFSKSQLVSTLSTTLTRWLVVTVLGAGAGIAVAAALRLRRAIPATAGTPPSR